MTEAVLTFLASNGVCALLLALLAEVLRRCGAPSTVVHGMWVVVLLKLVTPSVYELPVTLPSLGFVAERVEPLDAPRGEHAAELSMGDVFDVEAELDLHREVPQHLNVAADPFVDVQFADVPSVGIQLFQSEESESELPASGASELGVVDAPFAPRSPQPSAMQQRLLPVSASASAPTSISWPTLALVLWMLGALWNAGSAMLQIARFRILLSRSRPAPVGVAARVQLLADRIGLEKPPRVLVTDARISPMVWCFLGEPRLLLPRALLQRLDRSLLDTLLLHELAHVRRGDHLVRHVELLVQCLLWWNPIVWWASRRLREVEEECCDAWVVWALPDDRRRYAEALLGTVEFLSERSCSRSKLVAASGMSGAGGRSELKRRLTMIMTAPTRRALSAPARLAFGAFALSCLGLVPAVAQEQRPVKEAGPLREIIERVATIEEVVEQAVKNTKQSLPLITELNLGEIEEIKEIALAEVAELGADIEVLSADLEGSIAEIVEQALELSTGEGVIVRAVTGTAKGGDAVPCHRITLELETAPAKLVKLLAEAAEILEDEDCDDEAEAVEEVVEAMRRAMGRSGSSIVGRVVKPRSVGITAPRAQLLKSRQQLESQKRQLESQQQEFESARRSAELRRQKAMAELNGAAEQLEGRARVRGLRASAQRQARSAERASASARRQLESMERRRAAVGREAESARRIVERSLRFDAREQGSRRNAGSGRGGDESQRMRALEERLERLTRMVETMAEQQAGSESKSKEKGEKAKAKQKAKAKNKRKNKRAKDGDSQSVAGSTLR